MPDDGARLRASDPGGPRRRLPFGLRFLVLATLAAGFALSVPILGVASANLAARALRADHAASAGPAAQALLASLRGHSVAACAEVLEEALQESPMAGVSVVEGEARCEVGYVEGGFRVTATEGPRRLTLHLEGGEPPAVRALSGLLVLYVSLTGVVILLVLYLLLTRLIIRPVEVVTRASERVAAGQAASVPEAGAAELVRLGVAFNAMETALREEREALRARLEELEATTRELKATQASLLRSETLASVGRLAAGVAHEIGNPLSAIRGLLELAADGELPEEERRDFLVRATAETERIHRIIGELLAFARGEGPSTPELGEGADLAAVVEDALRLVAPQKELQRVAVRREIPAALPRVRSAPARLRQVVLNLLLNAADAMDGEGELGLYAEVAEDAVQLRVEDSGPGIPEEVLPHVFEPFVTTKAPGAGTGLGLAVSARLVGEAGGTLTAENREDGGARFVVTLPRA